jgi:hypothetical protein
MLVEIFTSFVCDYKRIVSLGRHGDVTFSTLSVNVLVDIGDK